MNSVDAGPWPGDPSPPPNDCSDWITVIGRERWVHIRGLNKQPHSPKEGQGSGPHRDVLSNP